MQNLELLVACADQEVRNKVRALAAERGLPVHHAGTVQQSHALMAEHSFALVFCDEQLPDGNFLDLLHAANRAAARIPLVVIARVGEWQEYLRAISLGAFDFIAPPFRRPELERLMRNALRESAPASPRIKAAPHKNRAAAAGKGLACAS